MHLVIVGGSDAGISAALRARELNPATDVTVVVADEYPNFSICGIPYYVAGDVASWQSLAHRTVADLEATGMRLALNTRATRIDVAARHIEILRPDGSTSSLPYDELVVGTGALPAHAGIAGLDGTDPLGIADGVHVLHSMSDTFALERDLETRAPRTAAIVGAGYVGLEMAEALSRRGIQVTQIQRGAEVLSTLDPELGALVRAELTGNGVEVITGTTIQSIARASTESGPVLTLSGNDGAFVRTVDIVLVVVGVVPNTELLASAGARLGAGRAVAVDRWMRTGLPHVWAAGDGVVTHHRLLGETYLPLGTTAHKQGRIAGENVVGGDARFAGSLGTQVVKVFDLVAARTGLRDTEAQRAGFRPLSVTSSPDDHKAYYPGARPVSVRLTGDGDGRLLGAQMVGRLGSEIAKRIDVYATAIFHDMAIPQLNELDLSYTPPLGSPWDAVQIAAQQWSRVAGEPGASL